MFFELFVPLMVAVFFASDCDKTLVFYDTDLQDSNVISLPPSSGSGKIAYVSKLTLALLEDVSNQCDGMICVSGMRSETMLQRYRVFPHIQFWITENGGRMFKRSSTSSTDLEEYAPYTDYVNSLLFEDGGESSSGLVALNELATSLRNEWQVDTYDYKTMIRIKPRKDNLESLMSLESRISKDLFSCTYNLGYLDIQIQGLGKYQSVKWLTQHLMKLNNGHDAMVQAIGKEEKKGEIKLLFMGFWTSPVFRPSIFSGVKGEARNCPGSAFRRGTPDGYTSCRCGVAFHVRQHIGAKFRQPHGHCRGRRGWRERCHRGHP